MGIFDLFKKRFETISVEAAQEAINAGAVLIDVRESHEFRAGHAPGAKLISLGTLQAELNQIPKEREILVICQSGMRSTQAAELLFDAGYKVKNIKGGMAMWQRSGLRVIR